MMTLSVWMFLVWLPISPTDFLTLGHEFETKTVCNEMLVHMQEDKEANEHIAYWSPCFEIEKTRIIDKSGGN